MTRPETGGSGSIRTPDTSRASDPLPPAHPGSGGNHHRRLKHGLFVGLIAAYLIPISILTICFNYKFNANIRESSKLQLAAAADSQRNTIDLFMQKRIVNLFNLFHMKAFSLEPDQATMESYLANLMRADNAFVDVGLIDPGGIQIGYAGPYPHLRDKDYSDESWYKDLINQSKSYIITDLYLGLRLQPHFTIGVKQIVDGNYHVIRSSVYPDKLQSLLQFSGHDKQVAGYLINREGIYQAVAPGFGDLMASAFYAPGMEKDADVVEIHFQGQSMLVAHTWLGEVPWCLVMLQPSDVPTRKCMPCGIP